MDQPLPAAARRVADAAVVLGLDIRVLEMPASTRTAEEAAAACGCRVGQIVKSLVFAGKTSGTPYLLLVSGDNRVNEKAMAKVLGEPLTRPDADFVRETTGFAIGGVAPIGHANALRTLFDEDLLKFDVIWAAAGTPRCVFETRPQALARATGAEVVCVTA
ncbi:MAG: YbaK/EbsC family protein [Rhodobiaceae bacterium]|nr:YbaK/EbsC family protein [Rhodobiaceae bacterium]MCC0015343.1 YbaK/EbsC family protein [Rhodobiaceae bacterium]MCC0042016.1 YbaK/EbsC family protein [Rhodobiaceae bacterium]MCC0053418.1 YbaK/EbsC family protein [Rhodobiaceae bacterium]